jgi:hypothetical protein
MVSIDETDLLPPTRSEVAIEIPEGIVETANESASAVGESGQNTGEEQAEGDSWILCCAV